MAKSTVSMAIFLSITAEAEVWTAEWEASLERRALLFAAENQQKRDAFKMLAQHQDTINIPWDAIYHYNIYIV